MIFGIVKSSNPKKFTGYLKQFNLFLLLTGFFAFSHNSFSQSGSNANNPGESVKESGSSVNSTAKYKGFQTLPEIYNRVGVIRLDDRLPRLKVMPDKGKGKKVLLKTQTATFKVHYTGFSAEAQAAFQYAVNTWASIISSGVPIVIYAKMESMSSPNILGQGGADDHIVNTPKAPIAGTAYALPLAEYFFNDNINHPDSADINLTFNTNFTWYYGTDGNCPNDKVDFVSVVLHEICHGLGYIPSMMCLQYQGQNLGVWGRPRYNHYDQNTWFPFIYDRFVYNGSGTKIMDKYPDMVDLGLYNELQSNNIYWKGPKTGIRKLYCPTTWEQGSSISHLDWTEPVNLMYPAIARGSVIHVPGESVLAQMADIGWKISGTTLNKISDENNSVSTVENYPNPFNSTTRIIFNLAENDKITINLYDILGRKIKTLVNDENYESGTYNFNWDGRDYNNLSVASGTYILKITGQKNNIAKKITILK
jgi:hypothetical protein